MDKGNNEQRSNGSSEDKEFALLLGATRKVDFIAASERGRAKTFERLMNIMVEDADDKNKRVDLAKAEKRIIELFNEQERRSRALLQVINEQGEERAKQLLKDIEGLRKFFFVISHSWEQARRTYGRWYVDKLMKEIRQCCPNEVAQYKRAWRDWRESRK